MSEKKQPTIEELKSKLAKADALTQQKSNCLATISHEIRTPMQSVYGLLELIEQENPDSNIMSMTRTAKNAAAGLLEILNDVLDFAKMDADQMVLDSFEVPVRTLVRGINEALSVKVQGKPVALKDEIEDEVPFVISGDPKRLRQVIMNLMGNAMKFTHEGSVTIRVKKECEEIELKKNQSGLRFEIIDTGIGMDQKVADTLFTPFSQEDSSTSRQYGGTGLGLSISKKLVELMNGKLGVTSQKDIGSTFWFEIPAQEVSTDVNSSTMPNLEGITVLSVEDHPQGAKEIMRSLQSMGATVESTATYKDGLDLIKARPFDVAIIDQGLPDGLGLNLIREMTQIRPATGFIMYTVRDDAGLQQTLQSLGVTYLTKPASRIGLGEAIQDASSQSHKHTVNGPKKLLIAEDTDTVRDVLQRQLDKLGVDVTFVENGKDALEAYQTGEYGILLTDLHMPIMDGYELSKTIRETTKDQEKRFPIIVITADVQMSQRQVYMSHGFDECLLKPITLGQFERLLIRWGCLDTRVEQDLKSTEKKETTEQKPAIDQKALIQQMGEINQDTIEMLGMFTEMTAPIIEKIDQAYKDKDIESMAEYAHSLKGAARSACANILGDYADHLQQDSEKGSPDPIYIEKIKSEFKRVEEEINNLS